jgi:amino acid permease
LVEKIQKLRFLALIGVSAISLFVVSVVYNFFKKTSGWNLPDTLHAFPTENPLKAIASIPNILLAFLYQMNFFPIFKGMKNASDKRMTTASWVASGACYIIYVSVAFLGYMTYGNNSDPDKAIQPNFLNILQREEIGDWLYIIMNLVFMISLSSILCRKKGIGRCRTVGRLIVLLTKLASTSSMTTNSEKRERLGFTFIYLHSHCLPVLLLWQLQ